jgi:hypothetical protein
MTVRVGPILRAGLAALAVAAAGDASAHGGLEMDKDECRLSVGPYLMHFTGYQPASDYSREFCRDIPATGRTIIVLDLVDERLRDLATEVRIIRADGEDDLERATIFHLPPQVYQSGSLSFDCSFTEPGTYVGLITVDDGGRKLLARFPFSVASSHWLRDAAALLLAAFGLVAVYACWRARGRGWYRVSG